MSLFVSKHQHALVWPDVNECAKDNGGCHAKRECKNTAGSMTCGDCSAGWDNDGAKSCKGLRLLTKMFDCSICALVLLFF